MAISEKKTQIPQNLEILAHFFSKTPLNEFELDFFLSPSDKDPSDKNWPQMLVTNLVVYISLWCHATFWDMHWPLCRFLVSHGKVPATRSIIVNAITSTNICRTRCGRDKV
jgi:hypothetical protein